MPLLHRVFHLKYLDMIEFDDYGNKLIGAKALEKRIQNRLTMIRGEIPHLSIGLWKTLFSYDDVTPVIMEALSDLDITGIQMNEEQTRIKVGDLVVDVSDTLNRLEQTE